ncbi:MAG: carbonic anhydrase [Geminicoccaceae bacterium]
MCTCDRRAWLGSMAAVALGASVPARADDDCVVFDAARQAAETPDQALGRLMDGNARLLAGKTVNCDMLDQIEATSAGQAPFAAIVGCIDSRVPPELIFDQRLGSVFSSRIAGNFVNTDIIGSLEFATRVMGAKLVLVLGHSDCGAIKGAIDNVQLGNLTATLGNIWPAVEATDAGSGGRTSKNKPFVQAVAETNARLAARMLTERSPVMAGMVDDGSLKVVAAMHDVATGRVSLLT